MLAWNAVVATQYALGLVPEVLDAVDVVSAPTDEVALVSLLAELVSGNGWSGDLPRMRFADAEHDQICSR